MITLGYAGRFISSRPGDNTVRDFIRKKLLRATNNLKYIIVCMENDLSHAL